MRLPYYIIFSLFLLGCAQFIPPTGGPIDKEPPQLISNFPENETTSFAGKTIKLEFNELIDVNALRQELIITPQQEGAYDLKVKPYGVEIKFDKAFRDSTTYTFNFRNGIKDLNEKNPATNLKLVFSTGTMIDSLQISGKIKDLFTGLASDKTLVGLYDLKIQDTIPLIERKPNYFIQTDTSGLYTFENIKSSSYRILGFQDINQNLVFDSSKEKFGFIQDTIKLDSNIHHLDFDIYPYNTKPPKIVKILSRQSNFSLTLDKAIKEVKIEFLTQQDSLTYQIRTNEILFFNHPFTSDTILTKIIVVDSSQNTLEIEQKIYFNTSLKNTQSPERLILKTKEIKSGTTIKKQNNYEFLFQYPISFIDTSKIEILIDTITAIPFNLNWLDKSHTQLKLEFDNTAEREIKLTINSGALINYKSDSNSTYQLINNLYQQNEYAGIQGNYDSFQGKKIIQLLEAQTLNIIDSQIFTTNYKFPTLLPTTYKIRIIEDMNDNGQWDSANFDNNELPEKVIVSKGILKLKANFQLNNLIIK